MKETISEQPRLWRKSCERESCYGDRVYGCLERQESLQNIADLYVSVEWLVSQNEQETTLEKKNTSTEKEENTIMLYLLFLRYLPAALARCAELEEMFITISSSSSSSRSRRQESLQNIADSYTSALK